MRMANVFSKTARYYDKLYAGKDYAGEVQRLVSFLELEPGRKHLTLLDVACGTGLHVDHLIKHFHVEGLDICPELLEIARKRNPDVIFHLGDMTEFSLGKQFDIITCLFSSIGYVKTLDRLQSAVRSMTRHLMANGTLVIEPWFTPASWHPNTVHASYVDEPELKIARINTSFVKDKVSVFDLHHLIGTPEGTEHIVEHHELGLFEVEETVSVMEEAGLIVEYDPDGLTGRGLYIGKRNELPNQPDVDDG
jgi:ubiquinone/menaquinone biosynthesis C-methylase UbiE